MSIVDPDGNVTQDVYDPNGNVVKTIDPNGKASLTWYNDMDEAVLSEDPDGNLTATAYNAVGNVVSSTDGAGDTSVNVYDNADELIAAEDPNGHVTLYGYNPDGQQISETDADGNTTQYVLNGLGNVVATVDPLGNVTQDVYNLNGQLVSQTDADGRTITYAYDNNGNLLTETDYNANGSVQDTKSYTYDPNGNVLTASNGYGTYTYTYDNNGNVLTQKDPFGLTLTYGYDGNGNVTSIQDSLGGTISKYYDAANQLTSIQFTNGTSQTRLDLTYTKDGQLSTLTRYKDTAGTQLVGKSAYIYDPAGNVTEIKHTNASGGALGDYTYQYDTANRLASETDTETGGSPVTTNYAYDAASQLTTAGSSGYSYGNRSRFFDVRRIPVLRGQGKASSSRAVPSGNGSGTVGLEGRRWRPVNIGGEGFVKKRKDATASLGARGHHRPDAFQPTLARGAACALRHLAIDHHKTNRLLGQVVGRVDAGGRDEPQVAFAVLVKTLG